MGEKLVTMKQISSEIRRAIAERSKITDWLFQADNKNALFISAAIDENFSAVQKQLSVRMEVAEYWTERYNKLRQLAQDVISLSGGEQAQGALDALEQYLKEN